MSHQFKNNSNSIYNYYKKLIALRESDAALSFGTYKTINDDNDSVVTFKRSYKNENVVVAVNLSSSKQAVNFTNANFSGKHFKILLGDKSIKQSSFSLNAYEVCVWKEE